MTKYLFYPGCSMESGAKAYDESLKAIRDVLGFELEEIHDWNCCGATEYLSISRTPAYALIARNLALASKQADGSRTLVASCSACYLNLTKADRNMAERPDLGEKVNQALGAGGLHYDPGFLDIRDLLEVIINDVGLETIKSKVVKPLQGLRVAPYLGCMVPRPDYQGRWSDHEHPYEFDRLLKTLGAEVIDFPLKTSCCGGHMPQISPSTAFELLRRLIHSAAQYNADMMVTVCPMCQLNLDAYQGEMNRFFHTSYHMPVVYFTQLMGLAFGIEPAKLGFGKELVDPRPALSKIGVEVAAPEGVTPRAKKVKKTGLPMPVMPGDEEVNE